jgi:hypothetical protein
LPGDTYLAVIESAPLGSPSNFPHSLENLIPTDRGKYPRQQI